MSLDLKFENQLKNATPERLLKIIQSDQDGRLADNGAIVCNTGEFTGRSPKDRFIVKDNFTKDQVDWGKVNQAFDPENFEKLYMHMKDHLQSKRVYIRNAYAGASKKYQISVRFYNTLAWHDLFCMNMFIDIPKDESLNGSPDLEVICVPDFKAIPDIHGTNSANFSILNMSKNILLIGGTGYSGEIKKGVFSYLNYKLPVEHNVLPMHCSSNEGKNGDCALFFGLSGTGKTTLSSQKKRALIGDDEHGWSDDGIFNFEGGCYAKTAGLSKDKEPEIFEAIGSRAILENTPFFNKSNIVDYDDTSITENTRVSYPLTNLSNVKIPSVSNESPNHIFFLTCDASGVLPPISKLNYGQAMYHFLSGYTAKIAGTELGITEPKAAFSACFGEPFLPLSPIKYAQMLGDRIKQAGAKVWLVNTGWIKGAYGKGERISLTYTRALISNALTGSLEMVASATGPYFGTEIPLECPGVPSEILLPEKCWDDQEAYRKSAEKLVSAFHENFNRYESSCDEEIIAGQPTLQADFVS
ncbi:MAG: phosphoenolpyruvate carboxykinase (ATP) [Reichenbachiella sp.]|uniref:phosphoenolpyruvate carboxykinase (ATP) n=1 Tax=Reichenbachiella sp. TaxID=2184521 RepID=UPI0032641476